MFIDEVRVQVLGGKGGDGLATMHREKYIPFGGPAGGSGGRGGSVFLVAESGEKTLGGLRGKAHLRAEPGVKGGKQNRQGRRGKDLFVPVPLGTLVRDAESGDLLADLSKPGDRFLAAKGGRGGRGNKALVTEAEPLPKWSEKGFPGEERWLRLELKVMADVGLVGLPNAGKSTLLSVVSNARPKVANYPFTTLEPHLGVVQRGRKGLETSRFVIADIPGLIEGAHEGVGLGDRFLRHVERTRLLVHLVDCSGMEGRDPVESYRSIRRELESAHPDLAAKPELVVASKLDAIQDEAAVEALSQEVPGDILKLSSVTRDGLDQLLDRIEKELEALPETGPLTFSPTPVHYQLEKEDSPFEVIKVDQDFYILIGPAVDRILATLDLTDEEALQEMDRLLRGLGAFEVLETRGAREGDTIRVGDFLFDYIPDLA